MTRWDRTLVGILGSVLPAGGSLPGIDPDRCLELLERIRREAPLPVRLSLHASAVLYLVTPIFTVRRLSLAPWLSSARLEQHTGTMACHRSYLMRQAMLMLKTVAGLCWGADPRARAALGMPPYDPDPGDWREA